MSYLTLPIAPSTEGAVAAAGSAVSFMAEKTFNKPNSDNQKFHTSVSVYNESESYPALFFHCLSTKKQVITWVAVSGTSVTPLYNAGVCADPNWGHFVFQYQVPANVDKIEVSINHAVSITGFGTDLAGVFSSWKLRSATPDIKLRTSISTTTQASAGQDFTNNVSVNVPSSTESIIWFISERPRASVGAVLPSVQDTVKRTDNLTALGNMFHLQGSDAARTGFSVSIIPNVSPAGNRETFLASWQVSCA